MLSSLAYFLDVHRMRRLDCRTIKWQTAKFSCIALLIASAPADALTGVGLPIFAFAGFACSQAELSWCKNEALRARKL
jgi:hypothetical protein